MIHGDQKGCGAFRKPARERRLPGGDLSAEKIQRRHASWLHFLIMSLPASRMKSHLSSIFVARSNGLRSMAAERDTLFS